MAEEKDDVSHFVINIPQECLVAKCGAEVRIYNSDGVYRFDCIFADYAISFELEEKHALMLVELMKKEQSLNPDEINGNPYYNDSVPKNPITDKLKQRRKS